RREPAPCGLRVAQGRGAGVPVRAGADRRAGAPGVPGGGRRLRPAGLAPLTARRVLRPAPGVSHPVLHVAQRDASYATTHRLAVEERPWLPCPTARPSSSSAPASWGTRSP